MQQWLLMCCMKEKQKYPQHMSYILIHKSNNNKYHYLVVRKLSALLRARTSKRNDSFYWLNGLYSIRTESKLKSHRKVRENNNFCGVVMPSDDTKKISIMYTEMKTVWSFVNI